MCWPAAPLYSAASSTGTSKASAMASSACICTCATRSEWNLSMASDALEDVEGLETLSAAMMRLAGSRAELADTLRIVAAAAWASDFRRRARGGNGDAECLQLALPLLAQPLAAPRRREHRLDDHIAQRVLRQRLMNGALDDLGRRTPGIGRRDSDAQPPLGRAN